MSFIRILSSRSEYFMIIKYIKNFPALVQISYAPKPSSIGNWGLRRSQSASVPVQCRSTMAKTGTCTATPGIPFGRLLADFSPTFGRLLADSSDHDETGFFFGTRQDFYLAGERSCLVDGLLAAPRKEILSRQLAAGRASILTRQDFHLAKSPAGRIFGAGL